MITFLIFNSLNAEEFYIIQLLVPDPPVKWILAIFCSVTVILLVVAVAMYKGWVYEQELDALLWKIDMKDVIISDIPLVSKSNKVCLGFEGKNRLILELLPAQPRYSSQVSLNSSCDLMEFRYYNVYTQIGLFKGRLIAIKRLRKKSLEINRKIKKELKQVELISSS